MAGLTTHVLDTANGCPAAGMSLRLYFEGGQLLLETHTNADGRCDAPLIAPEDMRPGLYRLEFGVADYYRARGGGSAGACLLRRGCH
ncbi:MAG: hydroxyisourate hydrolase [Robiginitomaculum sp.]|nr:hydroxyisourate hydrolase [Robiginitomaculum sp.]